MYFPILYSLFLEASSDTEASKPKNNVIKKIEYEFSNSESSNQ